MITIRCSTWADLVPQKRSPGTKPAINDLVRAGLTEDFVVLGKSRPPRPRLRIQVREESRSWLATCWPDAIPYSEEILCRGEACERTLSGEKVAGDQ